MPIFQYIMFNDFYMLLADFDAYCQTHERIANDFLDRKTWVKKSLLNTAGSGIFSIDRTVSEYAKDIWHVKGSK
jgi:starch phosphorylase